MGKKKIYNSDNDSDKKKPENIIESESDSESEQSTQSEQSEQSEQKNKQKIKKIETDNDDTTDSPKVIKIDAKKKLENKKIGKKINDKKILEMLHELVNYNDDEDVIKKIKKKECKQSNIKKYTMDISDDDKEKIIENVETKAKTTQAKLKKFKNIVEKEQTKEIIGSIGQNVVNPIQKVVLDILKTNGPGLFTNGVLPLVSDRLRIAMEEARDKRYLKMVQKHDQEKEKEKEKEREVEEKPKKIYIARPKKIQRESPKESSNESEEKPKKNQFQGGGGGGNYNNIQSPYDMQTLIELIKKQTALQEATLQSQISQSQTQIPVMEPTVFPEKSYDRDNIKIKYPTHNYMEQDNESQIDRIVSDIKCNITRPDNYQNKKVIAKISTKRRL